MTEKIDSKKEMMRAILIGVSIVMFLLAGASWIQAIMTGQFLPIMWMLLYMLIGGFLLLTVHELSTTRPRKTIQKNRQIKMDMEKGILVKYAGLHGHTLKIYDMPPNGWKEGDQIGEFDGTPIYFTTNKKEITR